MDWILVVFGAAVALGGGWIQLYPERVIPDQPWPDPTGPLPAGPDRSGLGIIRLGLAEPDLTELLQTELWESEPLAVAEWELDPASRAKIRLLGACFLFMGVFFTLQMTIDLLRCPWWIGSISGLAMAIAAVTTVYDRVRRQQRRGRHPIQQPPLAERALELRYPVER